MWGSVDKVRCGKVHCGKVHFDFVIAHFRKLAERVDARLTSVSAKGLESGKYIYGSARLGIKLI